MSKHNDDPQSPQDTGVSSEPVGECEDCGDPVTLADAKTESYQGPEGRIVLLFCEDCIRGKQ
jgi:hypothetical protein